MSVVSVKGLLKGVNYDDPVVKYRGEKVKRLAEKLAGGKLKLSSSLASDVFYMFYLPIPILREDNDGSSRDHLILKALSESPSFKAVRTKTVMDTLISSLAASIFLSQVKLLEEKTSRSREAVENNGDSSIKEIVEKALTQVGIDVENARRLKLIAEGLEPGSTSRLSFDEDLLEVIQLARDVDVRRILEILRGLKPWDIKAVRKKSRFKRGEILGYEYGRDFERMVPSNLALPDEIFYTRFAQKRLLLYEKAVEEALGPLYVLLDKSGSMDGTKITWAKAVAISLYLKAVKSNREFYLRFFDSQPYILVKAGRSVNPSEAIKLMSFVARVRGAGGTDISRAIITACTDIRSGKVNRRSDIVLITDGIDRVNENIIRYNLKKADSKLITVMIMGDNDSLRSLSYRYMRVEKLDREGVLRVVEFD
ncbi:MAG: VWA domain-containing protein [Desulfurococcus sp.]|nr:VWA domain-containing protein [Desulfurococcus sp.]